MSQNQQRQLNGWVFQEVIGKGSFAVVWKACRANGSQQVAIKEVFPNRFQSKLQSSLEREIQVLGSVNHENIVKLYEVFKHGRHVFLVLEYCAGGDLSGYLQQRGPLPEHLAQHIMIQIVSGYKALQQQDIIHRDLKPQNILLTSTQPPTIKIADLGFARTLPSHATAETLCGSPLYMAPEILHTQKYTAAADLWSLGAIFYELLAGQPLYEGASYVDILEHIGRGNPKLPEEVRRRGLSKGCVDLVEGLLVIDRKQRMGFGALFGNEWLLGGGAGDAGWGTWQGACGKYSSLAFSEDFVMVDREGEVEGVGGSKSHTVLSYTRILLVVCDVLSTSLAQHRHTDTCAVFTVLSQTLTNMHSSFNAHHGQRVRGGSGTPHGTECTTKQSKGTKQSNGTNDQVEQMGREEVAGLGVHNSEGYMRSLKRNGEQCAGRRPLELYNPIARLVINDVVLDDVAVTDDASDGSASTQYGDVACGGTKVDDVADGSKYESVVSCGGCSTECSTQDTSRSYSAASHACHVVPERLNECHVGPNQRTYTMCSNQSQHTYHEHNTSHTKPNPHTRGLPATTSNIPPNPYCNDADHMRPTRDTQASCSMQTLAQHAPQHAGGHADYSVDQQTPGIQQARGMYPPQPINPQNPDNPRERRGWAGGVEPVEMAGHGLSGLEAEARSVRDQAENVAGGGGAWGEGGVGLGAQLQLPLVVRNRLRDICTQVMNGVAGSGNTGAQQEYGARGDGASNSTTLRCSNSHQQTSSSALQTQQTLQTPFHPDNMTPEGRLYWEETPQTLQTPQTPQTPYSPPCTARPPHTDGQASLRGQTNTTSGPDQSPYALFPRVTTDDVISIGLRNVQSLSKEASCQEVVGCTAGAIDGYEQALSLLVLLVLFVDSTIQLDSEKRLDSSTCIPGAQFVDGNAHENAGNDCGVEQGRTMSASQSQHDAGSAGYCGRSGVIDRLVRWVLMLHFRWVSCMNAMHQQA